jgi:hypothetical protein
MLDATVPVPSRRTTIAPCTVTDPDTASKHRQGQWSILTIRGMRAKARLVISFSTNVSG